MTSLPLRDTMLQCEHPLSVSRASHGRQELNTTVWNVVISCHARLDAFVVQHVPFLLRTPNLPGFSTPATWCRLFHSRVFSAPTGTTRLRHGTGYNKGRSRADPGKGQISSGGSGNMLSVSRAKDISRAYVINQWKYDLTMLSSAAGAHGCSVIIIVNGN